MPSPRAALVWAAFALAVIAPLAIAGTSELLAWRGPVYITAGFAGAAAMALILAQPLLAGGYLPGLPTRRGRKVHRWIGGLLVTAVVIHVVGLWIVSPPDVIDVLLFQSPTPFSIWGVVAMWALFAAALLATFRSRLGIRPKYWRLAHTLLVATVVVGSIVHALLIEGTMGTVSKVALCAIAGAAFVKVVADLRVWALWTRRRA